ncbi:MAG: orotidine-5'-phosphate decarboxylase [Armatimonadetes bacterium]|nr:orotidine-5'-phosphate decarboxylase [Armatimonadota bacterium]
MGSQSAFSDRLMAAIEAKNSRLCVGLDPRMADLPESVTRSDGLSVPSVEAVIRFCVAILKATAPYAVAVKLQSAFFEVLRAGGDMAYSALAEAASRLGLITIADVKRSDIGSTAEAYAQAYLGTPDAPSPFDAVTVNTYFGIDGVKPFLDAARATGKGVFLLVRTSNPSAVEIQDLRLEDGRRVHEAMADLVKQWGTDLVGRLGYSDVGAVVGATVPQHLELLRGRMPQQPFLVPGYGAQGAGPQDVVGAFDDRGLGAIVNSSRAIIYAFRQEPYSSRYAPEDFAAAAAEAAKDTRDAINQALRDAGKLGPV